MKYDYNEVKKRIIESLVKRKNKSNKEYWFGFLVALLDYHQIPIEQYQQLRNMIDQF